CCARVVHNQLLRSPSSRSVAARAARDGGSGSSRIRLASPETVSKYIKFCRLPRPRTSPPPSAGRYNMAAPARPAGPGGCPLGRTGLPYDKRSLSLELAIALGPRFRGGYHLLAQTASSCQATSLAMPQR